MCVLFIAWQMHPTYPLVIAANRDEYFERPTAALGRWGDEAIIAGRDLQAGGTWLGVNTHGQLAALTNIRRPDLIQPHAKSRGELTTRYLDSSLTHKQYGAWLQAHAQDYNPFNLLIGSEKQLFTFNSLEGELKPLDAGFYSISNGALDDIWPKMARGTQALQTYIEQHTTLTSTELADLMGDSSQALAHELPKTGVPEYYEQILSSIFIPPHELPQGLYGTRSTTIVLQTAQSLSLTECTYRPLGAAKSWVHEIIH